MGEYVPFAGEHSIQEAAIAVHFQGELEPQQIELIRGRVHADLNVDFGRSQEIRGGNINIDMSDLKAAAAQPVVAHLAGFQFSSPKEEVAPDRILRFVKGLLMASFMKYPEWDMVMNDGLRYIKTVVSSLPLAETPIVGFSLRYVDRYAFDGPITDACAGLLFVSDNPYLAAHCFNAGPLWHCHSGWFEDLSDEVRVLNQLDVGSAVIDGAPATTIDHNAVWQLRNPRQSTESLFVSSNGRTGLKEALVHLHDKNKEILQAMLKPEMLRRIGMT